MGKSDIAARIAPGLSGTKLRNKAKLISRWSTSGDGLHEDLLATVFGVMRASSGARNRILAFFGIEIPEEIELPQDIQELVEDMKRARNETRWESLHYGIKRMLTPESRAGPEQRAAQR